MSRVVLLDSGPLGLLVHRRLGAEINRWADALTANGATVVVPEITYYELRRELIRIVSTGSVEALDRLADEFTYAALDRATLVRASEIWAHTRASGLPTASDTALDVDVILAATAERFLARGGDETVVATSNVGHLTRFVPAQLWEDIRP